MKNVVSRTTDITRGTEGPDYDPYSYSEFSMRSKYVDGKQMNIKVHRGLAEWYSINDTRYANHHPDDEQNFILLTGMTIATVLQAINRAKDRRSTKCSQCNSKRLEWRSGYPGESLLICTKCNHCCGTDFDMSAVI